MICAWIETSSEATGSSQTRNSGLHRERARDGDALALAAGELVRDSARVARVEADARQHVGDVAVDARPAATRPCARGPSPTCRRRACAG